MKVVWLNCNKQRGGLFQSRCAILLTNTMPIFIYSTNSKLASEKPDPYLPGYGLVHSTRNFGCYGKEPHHVLISQYFGDYLLSLQVDNLRLTVPTWTTITK